jgi:SAM-dependent methyltransferase
MAYLKIVDHYEQCLEKYGDSPEGVDWTRAEQVDRRYQVMLELINYRERSFDVCVPVDLLDYGCGLSHLYGYIQKQKLSWIHYFGLEISTKFYEMSRRKYPDQVYFLVDILEAEAEKKIGRDFDYVVMNGVFTEKRDLTYEHMWRYFKSVIKKVYPLAKKGLAFNLMSKQVEWEKDFLFHVPLDQLAEFLTQELTRDFIIRNDYGLYEYTVYVYKNKNEYALD